jgi:tripartite-type tricarboxylate transporter receptor subunit TctC
MGLVGPTGLPAPLVERLEAALRAAATEPEVAADLARAGAVLLGGGRDSLARRIREETRRWTMPILRDGIVTD